MQSRNIVQAEQLLSRHRFKEAEELLRLEISQNMENATAFSMLALALTHQDKEQEALPAVQRAISLEPENPYHFYIHSMVLDKLSRYEQAVQEIRKAIRLDPLQAHYYAILSSILIHLKEWKDALEAADKGLELDPQNALCSNMRALALTQMGRRDEASQTIGGLLSRDPENAVSHTNQGWTYLHKGEPKQALIHFREALRLQPGLDWARSGMLEALKARNIIYRAILAYYLWISRFKTNTQWGLIIGAFLGIRLIRAITAANPALEPWLSPVITAYLIFAFSTWIASPLFNLFLMLDPFGRMVLNVRERITARWVGGTILAALGLWIFGLVSGLQFLSAAAFGAFLMVLPVSGLAHARTKKTQTILGGYVIGLFLAGLAWMATVLLGLYDLADIFANLFIFGWIFNSWIASYLLSKDRG
jgi:tetratricopeptide (TPR) repeat protein